MVSGSTELGRIDGVLLDVDGVLTVSWRPLEGAVEAVAELRSRSIPFLLLTNTTALTRAELVARLADAGFELSPDDVMTAPSATGAYLRSHHPGARCYLITKKDISEDLAGVHLVDEDADVVVIGGAEDQFTYDNLNKAFGMLMAGASLVAMHRNLYWKTAEGLMLDAGAFVRALEEAAGVTATVIGKPARSFFDEAVGALGVVPDRVLMVGDDLRNDVLAAQAAGLRGVLVRTGKFREEELDSASGTPDAVIDSMADLPGLLHE